MEFDFRAAQLVEKQSVCQLISMSADTDSVKYDAEGQLYAPDQLQGGFAE